MNPAAVRSGLIVVLTGAGISKESGIDTFRDAGGLWENADLMALATPEGFARDPVAGHRFYNERRRFLAAPAIRPNPAHEALARLERDWPGEVLVVTQNVDDLHAGAGSRNLIHMHGELAKARCGRCELVVPVVEDLSLDLACAGCGAVGAMRPHVVWFGEMPLEMGRIYDALLRCDLFIAIGTSGNVYPAAGFVEEVGARGVPTVELNLEPSEGASLFREAVYGPASRVVPAYVDRLLGQAAR